MKTYDFFVVSLGNFLHEDNELLDFLGFLSFMAILAVAGVALS